METNYNYNNLEELSTEYLTHIKNGSVTQKESQAIFNNAIEILKSDSNESNKNLKEKEIKLIAKETLKGVVLNYLKKEISERYDIPTAALVINTIAQTSQLGEHLLTSSDLTNILKIAEQIKSLDAEISKPEYGEMTPILKELLPAIVKWMNKGVWTVEKQISLLDAVRLFSASVTNLGGAKTKEMRSFITKSSKEIAQNLESILENRSLTAPRITQALTSFCEHPPIKDIQPCSIKDFEKHLLSSLGDSELAKIWKKNHIGSLIRFYNHNIFYSPSNEQFYIKYQGRFTPLTTIIHEIYKKFRQNDKALYYTQDGLVHFDPENSLEIVPLVTRPPFDERDNHYKLTIVSAAPKEEGLSDPGHTWIRIQEPVTMEDGTRQVRIYSIGFFLRGKILCPDKFEFTPRGRIEVNLNIEKEKFDDMMNMFKLFKLYSHQKTSAPTDIAEKFNKWLQGDCVEFAVEMGLKAKPELVDADGSRASVRRMLADKVENPPVSRPGYKASEGGPTLLDRLKLPYRALLYGDPRDLRHWQNTIIREELCETFQKSPEIRPLAMGVL